MFLDIFPIARKSKSKLGRVKKITRRIGFFFNGAAGTGRVPGRDAELQLGPGTQGTGTQMSRPVPGRGPKF